MSKQIPVSDEYSNSFISPSFSGHVRPINESVRQELEHGNCPLQRAYQRQVVAGWQSEESNDNQDAIGYTQYVPHGGRNGEIQQQFTRDEQHMLNGVTLQGLLGQPNGESAQLPAQPVQGFFSRLFGRRVDVIDSEFVDKGS